MERRAHFRGRPRTGRRVELRFHCDGADSGPIAATTRDIGVGGAFIATEQPCIVGSALDVDIDVPGQTRPISLRAEVRWVAAAGEARETGMGVKFANLDVDALLALSDFFAQIAAAGDARTDG
ncbi:MAG TPA: PilZ domain-containing protein [Kofleriaceae bacterium]|nr:PilZ domain-containing protein [Kofleriaceae bacterium]